jgi:hypothetical protein
MLKVLTAVQARIHYAMKQEFKLLAAIIRDNTPEEYSYEPEVGEASAKQSDYDMVEVIPVSDPNAATMSQKVVQYQAVQQLSQSAPQIYDLPYLHRQMIEVLGVKNAEKIIPMAGDLKPLDPVSENMAIITGKPVKAFLYQDHESHIKVHTMAMQDPIIMQLIGQNPKAPVIQAAMQAHIAEHVGFGYRQKIEQQLGMPLPPADEKLPPQIEVALSGMMAQAAQQVLQQNQQQAQQQQAQQQAQDPVLKMQQQDLQIRQRLHNQCTHLPDVIGGEEIAKILFDLALTAEKSSDSPIRRVKRVLFWGVLKRLALAYRTINPHKVENAVDHGDPIWGLQDSAVELHALIKGTHRFEHLISGASENYIKRRREIAENAYGLK